MGLFNNNPDTPPPAPDITSPASSSQAQSTVPLPLPNHRHSISGTTTIMDHEVTSPTTKHMKPGLARTPSVQTRYVQMLLGLDEIPRLHNILAAGFSWILLAGFIVFPGTFTSVQNSAAFKQAANSSSNAVEHQILHEVSHIGLLWVAGSCCVIGAIGLCGLWFRWRENYVWLINRIFFPSFLNSIAGLLSTLVNVYTAQHGDFSVTAKVTAIVTGACTGVTLALFLLYNNWILSKVRNAHQQEIEFEPKSPKRESVGHMMKRKAHEPPLEPGSVV